MDHLLTTDMKITNTSTEIITDVSIRTIVITAEAIEITTMIIKKEAIVTIEIITIMTVTVIIETNMKKVLNNIKTGVHSKERNMVIYNLLDIIVHKIITSNKSMTIIIIKAMGTTSELTWT